MSFDQTLGQFNELSPTQEHFLKKYLLENRLNNELHLLSEPNCCQLFGPPFKTTDDEIDGKQIPLLKFFFKKFIETFPFIANNPPEDQISFWHDTVQQFLESFNLKDISDSQERQESMTKRKQVNVKLASGLLLFFNSMLITEKDLQYLQNAHLKPSDTGTLDKLLKGPASLDNSPSLDGFGNLTDYGSMKFMNDLCLNIVAIKYIKPEITRTPSSNSVDTSSTGSSWNPFKGVSILSPSINKTPRHHYEFVIQVTKRTERERGVYEYSSYFIPRAYHEFRKFERDLKKKYPGLMATEAPKLPQKLKHDEGVNKHGYQESSELSSERNSLSPHEVNTDDPSSFRTGSPTPNIGGTDSPSSQKNLVREKLRLALRGYLSNLIKHPEIIHSDIFNDFIFDPQLIYEQLPVVEQKDHESRVEHEKSIAETQHEFQKQTANAILELTKNFDEFKKNLIMNPEALSDIFKEIGETPNVENLSPLLKTFVEWSKLEVAATLYQTFLSVDNSSEWLQKCRKFHALFPYSIVYGILKFTNPVKIVSRVIDLLLANFPSFSLPLWGFSGSKDLKDASKSTSAKNLLSLIFIMLLEEDLNDFKKELKMLKEEKLSNNPKFDIFLERIEFYVNTSNELIVDNIKAVSRDTRKDLLLCLLTTDQLTPSLSPEDLKTYQAIEISFHSYEKINDEEKLKQSELYFNLKQYWQILLRKKDKDLMKQLWQEPELTQLIKKFLTIFYQPLMKVFAKCDIHIVFKDFQRFMDDLLNELTQLSEGDIYYLSPFEIFQRSKSVFDRHEKVLWGFIHNLYVNDDEKLFLNLIKWIEKFLHILRIKFTDPSNVTIDLELIAANDLDHELFLHQLNSKINKTLQRRQLLKLYLNKKAQGNEIVSHQDKIDDHWNNVNDEILGDVKAEEFGLNNEDIDDFNLLHQESEATGNTDLDKELHLKLNQLEKDMDAVGTSELDKFDHLLQSQLHSILSKID